MPVKFTQVSYKAKDAKQPWKSRFNSSTLTACAAVLTALLSLCVSTAAGDSSQPLRLAILSSEKIQDLGLADLLTARIQELTGVELVERDLLQKVLHEIALSLMFGADEAENRRKVGAILNADMLVLLSFEDAAGGKPTIKLVISDCSHGARLRIALIPLPSGDLENTCRELVEIVRSTLEHFKTGIKQIIGISHFISRNLVHDYDHFQAGYAYLLENALASSPGVAVIEVEEAHSIARENELAGDRKIERIVPLFVEGEFRVQRAVSQEHAKVRLTIRISDSNGIIKQIEHKDLAIDKAAAFIVNDVAAEILNLSKSSSVEILDKEKQLHALIKNADEFARLGEWGHSTDLREAVVLLKPDFVEQRIKLIDEYNVDRARIPQPRYSFQEIKYDKWRLSFEHLEYMICNRMVSIGKAVDLSGKTFYRLPSSTKPYKRDFIRRVYPKILDLEPSNPDPNCKQREYQGWYNLLIAQVESPRYLGCPGKEDLDLYLFIHDNLPDEMGPSERFILFLQDHAKPGWRNKKPYGLLWYYPPEYFTEQEFLDFITAMSHSTKPLSSFYGRYALLFQEYHLRISQGKAVDDLYNEIELLANDVEKHKFSILGYRGNSFYQEIRSLQQQIGQRTQRKNVDGEENPMHLVFKTAYSEGILYSGQVVNAVTGKPVEDALITIDRYGVQIGDSWATKTDPNGRFKASFKPSDNVYSFIAFKENYLKTKLERSDFGPVIDGCVALQPMPLFPAGKIEIYPCIQEYNSGRPCIEATNVNCWLHFIKDENDNSKEASVFFNTYGGFSSGPHIIDPVVEMNWAHSYDVPAGISFKLKFILYVDEWRVPGIQKTISIKQGETLNLSRLVFEPAIKIYVKAVDSAGNPIKGVPIRKEFDLPKYHNVNKMVVKTTNENGLAEFNVDPNSTVKFQLHIAERLSHLQKVVSYQIGGEEDAGKVFTIQVADEIRHYVK